MTATRWIATGFTILVRDGTFGMETAQTCRESTCTRGAIADLEQFGSYTLSSREIVDALAASGKRASGGDPFVGAVTGTRTGRTAAHIDLKRGAASPENTSPKPAPRKPSDGPGGKY